MKYSYHTAQNFDGENIDESKFHHSKISSNSCLHVRLIQVIKIFAHQIFPDLPICQKFAPYGIAQDESLVANIALSEFICHETLTKRCIFHTNEVAVFYYLTTHNIIYYFSDLCSWKLHC